MGNVCNRGLQLKHKGRNCSEQFDVAQLWPAELCGSAGPGAPPAPAVDNHFRSRGWCWGAQDRPSRVSP